MFALKQGVTPKNIELRKVSYSSSLSEETSAYTAQVWVDGVHVCDVSNHGQGGCDMQYPAKGKSRDDVEALDAWIKQSYEPEACDIGTGNAFLYEPDLEAVCGKLLDEHLLTKDLQRTLKRTIMFLDGDKLFTLKGKHEGVERAHAVTAVLRKNPARVVLNNLPFAEALSLYAKHGAAR